MPGYGSHTNMSFSTWAIFLAILAEIVYSQSSPPAVGIQLSAPTFLDWDVRFPLYVWVEAVSPHRSCHVVY